MKISLLAGFLTASALVIAPRAQAQSFPYAAVADSYSVEKNALDTVQVPVVLSKPSSMPISIQWTTRDGNAKAGSDYIASSGTVKFAPNQRVAAITVPIVGDSIEEPDEYFSVVLSNAQGAIIVDSVGNVGISDNDYSGTISVADYSGAEGNSGKTNFGFRITLSTPPMHAIPVGYRTIDGNAKAGSDYTAVTGALQFYPGEQSKTVNVAVTGDTTVESNETFSFQLGTIGYTLARSTATGTIINDDSTVQPFTAPSAGKS